MESYRVVPGDGPERGLGPRSRGDRTGARGTQAASAGEPPPLPGSSSDRRSAASTSSRFRSNSASGKAGRRRASVRSSRPSPRSFRRTERTTSMESRLPSPSRLPPTNSMARSTSRADRVALPRVTSSAVRPATPPLSGGVEGPPRRPRPTRARRRSGCPGCSATRTTIPFDRVKRVHPAAGPGASRPSAPAESGTGRRSERRDRSGQDDTSHGGQTHGGIIPAQPSPIPRPGGTRLPVQKREDRWLKGLEALQRVRLEPELHVTDDPRGRRPGAPPPAARAALPGVRRSQCGGSGGDAPRPGAMSTNTAIVRPTVPGSRPNFAAGLVDPVAERTHARRAVLRGGEVRIPQIAVLGGIEPACVRRSIRSGWAARRAWGLEAPAHTRELHSTARRNRPSRHGAARGRCGDLPRSGSPDDRTEIRRRDTPTRASPLRAPESAGPRRSPRFASASFARYAGFRNDMHETSGPISTREVTAAMAAMTAHPSQTPCRLAVPRVGTAGDPRSTRSRIRSPRRVAPSGRCPASAASRGAPCPRRSGAPHPPSAAVFSLGSRSILRRPPRPAQSSCLRNLSTARENTTAPKMTSGTSRATGTRSPRP